MSIDPCNDYLFGASFKGVPFFVNNDTEKYGRRIHTHEYPMRDDPFHEDLGEKYATFSVDGYVATVGEKDAIAFVCATRGPGLLILPAAGPVMCVCMDVTISRNKDRQGRFDLKFEFRREGESTGGMIGSAVGTSLLTGLGGALGSLMLLTAASALRTGFNVLPYVTASAVNLVRTVAGQVNGSMTAYRADASLAPAVIRDSITLFETAHTAVLTAPTRQNVGFVTKIGSLIEGMADALSPDDAISALLPLAAFSMDEELPKPKPFETFIGVPPEPYSGLPKAQSAQAYETNAAVLNGIVRSYGILYLARAATAKTYSTRSEAIQMRADLAELFNVQIIRWNDLEIVKALITARDYAIKPLSNQIANIAPVIEISAPKSMPSLYWAHRLYDDADRAYELYTRNNVASPSFMPQVFEALTE